MANNKVIVIDDDPSVLRGIARVLKTSGFDPILFDCAESFESARNTENSALDACCLVIDLHLKGKSGLELRQALGNDLPIIFITASDSQAISTAAHEAGCVAFLRKPFSARSLIDPIRLLLSKTD